jgi:flagellar biosynthetic protein FlhB
MADRDQRTEQPTPHRLRKAREEGRFPSSREAVAAAQFLVFTSLACGMADQWWPACREWMRELLGLAFRPAWGSADVNNLLHQNIAPRAWALAAAGAILTSAALVTQLTVTGFGLAGARLAPDFSRLNPVTHLRELPAKNRRALAEAVVLLPLLLGLAWYVVAREFTACFRVPLLPLEAGVAVMGAMIAGLLWKATFGFAAWGAVDYLRQKRRYMNDLKMTKQEIRDEYKQQEGSPEVKLRIRRLRRQMLQRRMMAEVPKSTAVIVNPTHFAVALKYGGAGMAAPKVVAKGKNYLALRIRQKALDHQVPVIENPPLAQALYKQVELGQEIPPHLYRAVAEVLAYIYRMLGGRLPGAD